MSKISICHVTSAHADGDVRIFHKECVSLAEAGFDTNLIITNSEDRTEKGVRIWSVNYKPTSRIKRFTKSVDLVYKKALEVDADLYHLHDPELLRIALKLKRKGKKVIFDAHEDLPKQILSKKYINKYLRKIISYSIAKYEKKITSKLDAVITATPFIRDKFLEFNQNSIDINNFPLSKEIVTNDSSVNDFSSKDVCYIGGITEIRGLKEVITSLAECKSTKLKLAGDYSPASFRDTLTSINSWSQVEELGYIDRNQSLSIKSTCIAGIVTFYPEQNHINAQPNKIFEYMASGLPVIGSKFPLWEEIITKNDAGICVNPLNPDEISDAINFLIANPDKAKQMGENGKRMVIEKYNWDQEKQKLITLYKGLFSK